MADKLAKEAANNDQLDIIYNKTPIISVCTKLKKVGLAKWQSQWNSQTRALCRSLFPTIEQRLNMKLSVTSKFIAIVTGHRKIKAQI